MKLNVDPNLDSLFTNLQSKGEYLITVPSNSNLRLANSKPAQPSKQISISPEKVTKNTAGPIGNAASIISSKLKRQNNESEDKISKNKTETSVHPTDPKINKETNSYGITKKVSLPEGFVPNPIDVPAKTRRDTQNETIARNSRTVFIGNLATSATERANTKELKKIFSQFGTLKSIRSIAFAEKMPRKVSFITKKFHEGRDSLNAYIVYEESSSADASLTLNGSVFQGKHIRVDKAEKNEMQVKQDAKRSVFVGNIPFDVSEESLWQFFDDVGEIENVRVIRDRKTNVGKGFAYIQFRERSCVDLALALAGTQFSGRDIRISRSQKNLAEAGKNAKSGALAIQEGTRASRGTTVKIRQGPSKSKDPRGTKTKESAPMGTGVTKKVKKPRHVPRVPK